MCSFTLPPYKETHYVCCAVLLGESIHCLSFPKQVMFNKVLINFTEGATWTVGKDIYLKLIIKTSSMVSDMSL